MSSAWGGCTVLGHMIRGFAAASVICSSDQQSAPRVVSNGESAAKIRLPAAKQAQDVWEEPSVMNGIEMADRQTVEVALGERAYRVIIGRGLIENAGSLIKAAVGGRCGIVTDHNVAQRHLDSLVQNLEATGLYKG